MPARVGLSGIGFTETDISGRHFVELGGDIGQKMYKLGEKQTLGGIRDKVRELLNKIKASNTKIEDSKRLIEESNEIIKKTAAGIPKIKSIVERHYAENVLKNLRKELKALSTRESIVRNTAGTALRSLKKILSLLGIRGNSGIGVLPVLPIAAVAALAAAAAFLWKQTVTKTREINIKGKALDMLSRGEITSKEFTSVVAKAKQTGGFFGQIKTVLILAAAAFVLPQILTMVKARR